VDLAVEHDRHQAILVRRRELAEVRGPFRLHLEAERGPARVVLIGERVLDRLAGEVLARFGTAFEQLEGKQLEVGSAFEALRRVRIPAIGAAAAALHVELREIEAVGFRRRLGLLQFVPRRLHARPLASHIEVVGDGVLGHDDELERAEALDHLLIGQRLFHRHAGEFDQDVARRRRDAGDFLHATRIEALAERLDGFFELPAQRVGVETFRIRVRDRVAQRGAALEVEAEFDVDFDVEPIAVLDRVLREGLDRARGAFDRDRRVVLFRDLAGEHRAVAQFEAGALFEQSHREERDDRDRQPDPVGEVGQQVLFDRISHD
jgi:hypothetical protein